MHKKCGTCLANKPIDDFHNNLRSRDGRTSRCKACAIVASRESYERRKRDQKPDIDLVREHRARLAAAREAGATHFLPLIPCPAGHLGPRFTVSQCCKECGMARRRAGADNEARIEKKRAAVKRKAALQLGQTHYQGRPCQSGHGGLRLASTRQCVECLAARTQPRPTAADPDAHRRRLARRRAKPSKIKQRAYQKDVLMKRPEYLVKRFMYACLRRILLGAGVTKRSRTAESIGYAQQELKAHIESLFRPGMTWENYGEWHIDHVRAISAFLADGVTDPAIINALANLQPLWALENMSKGGVKRPRATA